MGFSQESYDVAENDNTVEICVELTGDIGTDIWADLSTNNVSAEGIFQLLSSSFFSLCFNPMAITWRFFLPKLYGCDIIILLFLFLDGQDYTGLVQHTLTFPSGSSSGATECVNISIIDDEAFEKDEVFSVHIVDFEEGIIFNTSYVEVMITDDEGINTLH